MKNSQDSTVLEIVTADLEGLSTCGKSQWAGSPPLCFEGGSVL